MKSGTFEFELITMWAKFSFPVSTCILPLVGWLVEAQSWSYSTAKSLEAKGLASLYCWTKWRCCAFQGIALRPCFWIGRLYIVIQCLLICPGSSLVPTCRPQCPALLLNIVQQHYSNCATHLLKIAFHLYFYLKWFHHLTSAGDSISFRKHSYSAITSRFLLIGRMLMQQNSQGKLVRLVTSLVPVTENK